MHARVNGSWLYTGTTMETSGASTSGVARRAISAPRPAPVPRRIRVASPRALRRKRSANGNGRCAARRRPRRFHRTRRRGTRGAGVRSQQRHRQVGRLHRAIGFQKRQRAQAFPCPFAMERQSGFPPAPTATSTMEPRRGRRINARNGAVTRASYGCDVPIPGSRRRAFASAKLASSAARAARYS